MEADSHFLEFVSTLRLYYRSPPPPAAAAPALEKFGTQGGAAGKKGCVHFSKVVRNFCEIKKRGKPKKETMTAGYPFD